MPFQFALAITVPVVDLDRKDGRWNRTLAVTNMFLTPLWFVASTGNWQVPKPSETFPLWALTLVIGAALALIVLLTSRSDKPPVYLPVRLLRPCC